MKHSKSSLSCTQLDVICVDLDGGVIAVPECVTIPRIPDPYYTCAVEALTKVTNYINGKGTCKSQIELSLM